MVARSISRILSCGLLCLFIHSGRVAHGRQAAAEKERGPIQDNSFQIEEAYNQERGVVQHISTFSRMWNSKDWSYTFTEEWPGRQNPRHQFSYTLTGMHAGDYASTGMGWGDMLIHYRYQVLGSGETRFAFAPRLSMMLPTGDVASGRGLGSLGVQTNLPLSVVLTRRLVSHWNVGATLVPRSQDWDHCRTTSVGYNLGQSLVYLLSPRFNLLVETTDTRFQTLIAHRSEWDRAVYVSPGIRWAYNFKSGLQIVPGLAMPIGVASSAGERGIFLYLSFEHPFHRMYPD